MCVFYIKGLIENSVYSVLVALRNKRIHTYILFGYFCYINKPI